MIPSPLLRAAPPPPPPSTASLNLNLSTNHVQSIPPVLTNPSVLKNTLETSLVALERSVVLAAKEVVDVRQAGSHAGQTEVEGDREGNEENGSAFFL